MRQPIKISDTDQDLTAGSRADNYWERNPNARYYELLRPGFPFAKVLKRKNNVKILTDKFRVNAVGFGNWLSIEDRINYVNAAVVALADLNKVLQFGNNVGIDGSLSLSFGARGNSRAAAHYEPATQLINITRFKRGKGHKFYRFFSTGGIGALAHEYGHFLDYFSGSYLDKDNKVFSLSGGSIVEKNRVNNKTELRGIVDDIIERIIWTTPGKTLSPYYNRLLNKNKRAGDYFFRRNELFARAFEVFVSVELKKKNIINRLLVPTKYDLDYYLSDDEMRRIAPLFKKLIKGIRAKIKQN